MRKIKSIIFDLDGVLVDTKNIHFEALNKSLLDAGTGYQISYKDHVRVYDGLPTLEKLKIFSCELGDKKITENDLDDKNIRVLVEHLLLVYYENKGFDIMNK